MTAGFTLFMLACAAALGACLRLFGEDRIIAVLAIVSIVGIIMGMFGLSAFPQ